VVLTVDRTSASLELPVIDGPSPVVERPVLPPPNPAGASASAKEARKDDPSTGWVKWAIAHEALAHATRAEAGSAGDYGARDGATAFAERYDGVVRVSLDDPGTASSSSEGWYELRFPEATCAAHAEMTVESDRQAYRVGIDLVVSEDGVERWRRRWDRTFPRDLQ
jgi:hypothetical protein